MTLEEFNALEDGAARQALLRCCGCADWAAALAARRPFSSADALLTAAAEVWMALGEREWLEAFAHHPRIGGKDALRAKFAATRLWAQGEQSGVSEASEAAIEGLAQGNEDYERRFGRIFIVCATGKSADEMLALLRARLGNDPQTELRVAAAEQAKITRLRLEKLLSPHA